MGQHKEGLAPLNSTTVQLALRCRRRACACHLGLKDCCREVQVQVEVQVEVEGAWRGGWTGSTQAACCSPALLRGIPATWACSVCVCVWCVGVGVCAFCTPSRVTRGITQLAGQMSFVHSSCTDPQVASHVALFGHGPPCTQG